MFGYPHMFGHPPYVCMPPICLDTPAYVLISPVCLDIPYVWMAHILRMCPYAPNTFVHPHMFGHPPYVWMPPVHTQHKESMFCQTEGVSIYPHIFGCPNMFGCPLFVWMHPLYVWMAPYVWMPPIYLDALLYVWMSSYLDTPISLDAPVCLDAPICLDIPHMFGCPNMFGCPPVCLDVLIFGHPHIFGYPLYVWMLPLFGHPPYVWMMYGCHLYIHNTKKACFVTLRSVHMPHTFGCPICLDTPLYVWMPPCLDGPCMFECPHMCGHPLYV